jgi:soluble lytic murein transglycosylase-like protein
MMVFLVLQDYNAKKHSQVYLWETAVIIAEESRKGNVDPLLVTAIAYTESKFVTTAKSKSGCCGVMQVMPRYSKYTCKQLYNRRINIQEGIRKMNAWKARFGKEWVCHYNGGNVCKGYAHKYARFVHYLHREMRKRVGYKRAK